MNIKILVIGFSLITSSSIWAKNLYTCSNTTAEIRCENDRCETLTQPNFTPTQIHVSTNNQVSICMYSGCWEARTKPILKNNYVIYNSERFVFNQTLNKPTSFLLSIHPKSKLGFLHANHFLLPLQCQ